MTRRTVLAGDGGVEGPGSEVSTMIAFEGVSKRFYKGKEPVQAIGEANFHVNRGEFVSVVGPSGCGKSTLLNIVAGLIPPTGGEVLYDGAPVKDVNTKLGYVTQNDTLLPWRTVRDNIGIVLEIRKVPASERKERTEEMIHRVGLDGFDTHYPSELSGGMRKRVILARTLIYNPETLAMDEPFGALDAQLKLVLQEELLRLWTDSDKTILFVTHDLSEAVTLSDRVIVLSSRPSRVKLVQEIDLPRPRDVFRIRFNSRFAELNELLWQEIQEDMKAGDEM